MTPSHRRPSSFVKVASFGFLIVLVAVSSVTGPVLSRAGAAPSRPSVHAPLVSVRPGAVSDLARANHLQTIGADQYALLQPRVSTTGPTRPYAVQLPGSDLQTIDLQGSTGLTVIAPKEGTEILVPDDQRTTVRQRRQGSVAVKIDPIIHERLEQEPAAPVRVIIESAAEPAFTRTQTQQTQTQQFTDHVQRSLQGTSAQIVRSLPIIQSVAATIDIPALQRLEQDSSVQRVVLDTPVQALLDTSLDQIHVRDAWSLVDGTGNLLRGAGERIAIIDTGVDYTHPDLGGCFGTGCKVVGGYDFQNNDPDPIDDHGHGTHVAATAAGSGILEGVAPDATIVAYKVLDSYGFGEASTIIAAIEQTVDPNGDGDPSDHVDVASMSLGGFGDPDDPMSQAVDAATAAGVVFTIAAGNSGPEPETIASPGLARTAITVAASCKTSEIGVDPFCMDPIADFSSRGPVIWNGEDLHKPDLAAPGVNICAARMPGAIPDAPDCIDGQHMRISGTSMATPHVAGLAALVRQAYPTLTPDDVKALLKSTARDLGMPTDAQGVGEVDARTAITLPRAFSTSPSAWSVTTSPKKKTSEHEQNFRLTSMSDTTLQLTVGVQFPTPGISFHVNDNTFRLRPGRSKTIEVEARINNDRVPAGSYHGQIEFRDNHGQLRGAIFVAVNVVPTIIVTAPEGTPMDYGLDNPTLDSWTSDRRTITVQNLRRDRSQTLTVSPSAFPDGVQYQSPTTVKVKAGKTTSFRTRFVVDNGALPNGIYDGTVALTNATNRASLPLRFAKFFAIDITLTSPVDLNTGFVDVFIHDRVSTGFFEFLDTQQMTVYVDTAGPYDLQFEFFDYDFDLGTSSNAFVYREGAVATDGRAAVNAGKADAVHAIEVQGTDIDGNPKQTDFATMVKTYLPNPFFTILSGVPTGPGNVTQSSDMSDAYNVQLFADAAAYDDPRAAVYTFFGTYTGLSGDAVFTNTPADLARGDFQLDINRTDGPVTSILVECLPLGWCASSFFSTTTLPFTQTVYTTLPPNQGYSYFQQADLDKTGCPETGACASVAMSPWVDVAAGERRIGYFDFFGPSLTLPALEGTTQYTGLGPSVWTGMFDNDPTSLVIRNVYGVLPSPFLRQDFTFGEHEDVPFTVSQGGSPVASGTFQRHLFSSEFLDFTDELARVDLPSPGAYDLHLDTTVPVHGVATTMSVDAHVNTSLPDPNAPSITKLWTWTDGTRSETYDPSATNLIRVGLDPIGGTIASVTAGVATDGVTFAPMTVTPVGGEYQITLPGGLTGTLVTIRLMATDAAGNALTVTFDLPHS